MHHYLKIFTREMFLIFAAVVICPPAVAVNDFWLGDSFSIHVAFAVKHVRYQDPPKLKEFTMPTYPIDLFRNELGAKVTVQFIVGEDGSVSGLKVVKADNPDFAQEVKAKVEKWSFMPGKNRQTGQPMAVEMQCEFACLTHDSAKGASHADGWDGASLDAKPASK